MTLLNTSYTHKITNITYDKKEINNSHVYAIENFSGDIFLEETLWCRKCKLGIYYCYAIITNKATNSFVDIREHLGVTLQECNLLQNLT